MKHFFLIIGLLIFNVAFCQQELRFKHLNREDGLANSTVEALYQDTKGFIWIGTPQGLNRFDGYTFDFFQEGSKNRSICNNYILNITEDSKKRLWIATTYGVALYDEVYDIFITKNQPKGYSNYVFFVFENNEGKIIAGTENGINIYDEKSKSFQRLENNLSKQKVKCIVQDNFGKIWIGTENDGLYIYNTNFKQVFKLNNANGALRSNNINCLSKDKNGRIWVGYFDKGIDVFTNEHTKKYSFIADEHSKTSLSSNVIKCITLDSKNNIWIGTENGGLNIWNEQNNIFTRIENTIENPDGLSQKTVSSIIEDSQNNIWIGTHRGGLNIYSPFFNSFIYFTQGEYKKSLSFKDVKSFAEGNDGKLYIGTDGGGMNVWNRLTNTIKYYKHDVNNAQSISSNAVLCTYKDSYGYIWTGTWEGGLCKFNPITENFTTFKHDENNAYSISSDKVWKVIEDKNNNLWIGTTNGGVCVYEKDYDRFIKVNKSRKDKSILSGNDVSDLCFDKNGTLWIATQNGLNRYSIENDHFTLYFSSPEDKISSQNINTLHCDASGGFWVVTNKGLYKYDYEKENFTYFHFRNAPLYNIKSIIDDNEGNLWCGTQNGLLKINIKSGDVKRYTVSDGLQGLDFSRSTCLKLSSGELVFGGYNGFNLFKPSNISVNTTPPKIYIRQINVLNKPVYPSSEKKTILRQQIFSNGSIRLTHDQSALFSVEFAAINYISTSKNQYSYKLEGYDKNWNYLGSERKVTFTNLDPGDYTLHIRASNNDGIWNMQGSKVHIKLLPPFWKTWWFRAVILIAIIALLYFYFSLYKNLINRRLQEKKKEEMYDMQLNFFTHVSHELRTPLSIILGATEKMEGTNTNHSFNNYYQLLHKNVNRMVSLIKEIMDFRKLESGIVKLKVEKGNFNETVIQLSQDFIPIAENKKIDYAINISKNENKNVWFDKQIIETIVLNILNNAFKYTDEKGKVSIEILDNIENFVSEYTEKVSYQSNVPITEYLYIIVRDTGIGISTQSLKHIFDRFYKVSDKHLGSGVGLALVKGLTLLHKGKICVYSERNTGTDIIVGIPYTSNNYTNEEKNNEKTVVLEHVKDQLIVDIPEEKISLENESTEKENTILIVEDNEDLRNFLHSTLQQEYNVYSAKDGVEGFEKSLELLPSLIITDVMMPKMDGNEMARRIRANEMSSHIPIIMLTAKEGSEAEAIGVESGADYYFTKPISLTLLSTTIKNIFTHNKKLKEHYLKDYKQEIRDSIRSSKHREIMDTFLLIIESEVDNPDLNVEYLCKQMGMSKTKLFNVIKQITGSSINEMIRKVRLKKAVYIMTNEEVTINEVMSRVGILSASYFSKAFKKEYGKTPSEYYHSIKNIN